ncbi:MAG: restriction endonuclease subunit S [Alphaproteobacteria bacterium]|nr:restriction endonuclease subunit S [Alphaproteobacteria bacterium]
MTLAWDSRNFADAPVDIIDGDRGGNYPKQDEFYKEGHCLFLNTGNITIDGFSFSDCQFITEDKDRALRKGKLTRQDVVMTTRGTIGNVGYFNYNVPYENIRINSGMVIFRTDENKLLASFLYQYLRSTIFNKKVQGIRSGAAQPQLPIRDIKTISIPLPLIEVQWRLVSILSAYDDLIENNRRRIVLLEEAAQQLYKEWFIRFRFPVTNTSKSSTAYQMGGNSRGLSILPI